MKGPTVPTDQEIEAGAAGMYGKDWNNPDPQKRPGEKMKDVWRRMSKDTIEAVDEFRKAQRTNQHIVGAFKRAASE